MKDHLREIGAVKGPRKITDAPFCWQHKGALRFIRESFDAAKTVTSALAVYNALTEIASDKGSEMFTTTHAYIALKCGMSARTVEDRVADLAEIGLVEIFTPRLKAPSTYRLLSVPQPLPNDKQPLPNVPQRAKKAPLPTLEESNEESEEKNLRIVNAAPQAIHLTSLTANAASMQRIARDIVNNERGWFYDNCKVPAAEISPGSLETVLQALAEGLTELEIHQCWQEAVTRTHNAIVDGLPRDHCAYVVTCFKEQLIRAFTR